MQDSFQRDKLHTSGVGQASKPKQGMTKTELCPSVSNSKLPKTSSPCLMRVLKNQFSLDFTSCFYTGNSATNPADLFSFGSGSNMAQFR